jgi:hypothetical protein
MSLLPDPRHFATHVIDDALVRAAIACSSADEAQRAALQRELVTAFADRLELADADGIRRSLAGAPDADAARAMFAALARAVDGAADAAQGPVVRAFVLPLIVVAGAAKRTVVPGVLADAVPIAEIFERRGATGLTRNFGLSNALASAAALEALSPVVAYRALRGLDATALHAALPPEDIVVDPGREQAHLRFLAGAGVVAADAPSFAETGANVGSWGKECSQAIGRALAQPGVQLLVLPRPPVDLVNAPHAGRLALLEVALHLFVSNGVRRMRLQVGDPTAILSTHSDGDLRLTLSSAFADDLIDGFRWPLGSLDDLVGIQRSIEALLAEVRVGDVRVLQTVLPAERPGGGLWHPRVAEWETLGDERRH